MKHLCSLTFFRSLSRLVRREGWIRPRWSLFVKVLEVFMTALIPRSENDYGLAKATRGVREGDENKEERDTIRENGTKPPRRGSKVTCEFSIRFLTVWAISRVVVRRNIHTGVIWNIIRIWCLQAHSTWRGLISNLATRVVVRIISMQIFSSDKRGTHAYEKVISSRRFLDRKIF